MAAVPALAQDATKSPSQAPKLTVQERAAVMQGIMKALADKAAKAGVTRENVASRKAALKAADGERPATAVRAMPWVPAVLTDCAICAACAAEAFAVCAAAAGPEDPACEAAIVAIADTEPWCAVSCYACF
jgi:hypothetical protein